MLDNSLSSTVTLPDEVAILRGMVAELSGKLSERDSVIERLKHELLLLHRWRFGRKSEKLGATGQLSLFPVEPALEVEVKAPAARPAGKGRGRKPIPANLPVERVEVDVPAGEKSAPPAEAKRCASAKRRARNSTILFAL